MVLSGHKCPSKPYYFLCMKKQIIPEYLNTYSNVAIIAAEETWTMHTKILWETIF